MPYTEVMSKFKSRRLRSGGKNGPLVRSRKQAIAILLSEKRAAEGGKREYAPSVEGLRRHKSKRR